MLKPILMAFLSALTATACATPIGNPQSVPGIKITTLAKVQDCDLITDVHGVSPMYGVFAAAALDDSRTQAMLQAKAAGATHIVWDGNSTGYGSTAISGNAYKCPSLK